MKKSNLAYKIAPIALSLALILGCHSKRKHHCHYTNSRDHSHSQDVVYESDSQSEITPDNQDLSNSVTYNIYNDTQTTVIPSDSYQSPPSVICSPPVIYPSTIYVPQRICPYPFVQPVIINNHHRDNHSSHPRRTLIEKVKDYFGSRSNHSQSNHRSIQPSRHSSPPQINHSYNQRNMQSSRHSSPPQIHLPSQRHSSPSFNRSSPSRHSSPQRHSSPPQIHLPSQRQFSSPQRQPQRSPQRSPSRTPQRQSSPQRRK